ncbi:peptidoglycan hydrolase-like protein with peptidoglycan-binding domain, partial [Streptomonospora salina]
APGTGQMELGGFRYRLRPTLRLGDQGQAVTDLQNELLDLGYDLGQWGADGDYGQVTADAVTDLQTDYGLSPIDGQAGPETRAAMDLALARIPDPLWVSHLAVADDGAWIGPATAPETTVSPRLVLGTPI